MTYLNLDSMKDYEKGLKNKCAHPWLVCGFAIIFVLLTSLLIYVAWSPQTIEETIKINVEEVPEAHVLYQESEEYPDLNSTLRLSNLTKGPSKNLTALQKYNESSGSDEKVHIMDLERTTTEKTSDEILLLIFEEPVFGNQNDWSDEYENSGDLDPKPDPNLEKESPWSIIKKSWRLESQIFNISNQNLSWNEAPKIFPNADDFLTADDILPYGALDDPKTSETPDYPYEEEEFFIILPNVEPEYPDLTLDDLKVNNPIKELLKILQNFMDSEKNSNNNETSTGPDPLLDLKDPKVPEDLKDLIKNVPDLVQNPMFGTFLNRLFPENENDVPIINLELLGPNDAQVDPMEAKGDRFDKLLDLIRTRGGFIDQGASDSTSDPEVAQSTQTFDPVEPKRDPFSRLLELIRSPGGFFDQVSESTSDYSESSQTLGDQNRPDLPWSFDPAYDEDYPQNEGPSPKFVGTEGVSTPEDPEVSTPKPNGKYPKKWKPNKEPEVFSEEDQTKSVESDVRELLTQDGDQLNKMGANKDALTSKDLDASNPDRHEKDFGPLKKFFYEKFDSLDREKLAPLETRVIGQDGRPQNKMAAKNDTNYSDLNKNDKKSALKDFSDEKEDSPGPNKVEPLEMRVIGQDGRPQNEMADPKVDKIESKPKNAENSTLKNLSDETEDFSEPKKVSSDPKKVSPFETKVVKQDGGSQDNMDPKNDTNNSEPKNDDKKSTLNDFFDETEDSSDHKKISYDPKKVDPLETKGIKQDGGSQNKMADSKAAKFESNFKNTDDTSSSMDIFDRMVNSPGVWHGSNRITEPDENFNTYKDENKFISTTQTDKRAAKDSKKDFRNKFDALGKDSSGNSPEDLFEDYLTTRKKGMANTQRVPVTDEE